MKNNPFKSSDPLMECMRESNMHELLEKNREYTRKAQLEGKPHYKWDFDVMRKLMYEDGCEGGCNVPGVWEFIANWLSLTLKFVDDDDLQYYMNEFYEGRLHYTAKYYDKTIYGHMYEWLMPYTYVLYAKYLEHNNMEMPKFISKLVSFYIGSFIKIRTKIPSDDGMHLIVVSEEEAEKYNGVWISPEEHEEIRKRLDERREEFLRKRGIIEE